ncbi:YwqH-like family protein [Ruminococcus albus]|uniref:Uncharacterized protein n=1 Tax=Ruminococcus albus TaxID=1264 RepID=A0A1H7LWE2_RUMAL|nr:DUF5082 family protein [Ruminococcus albus]SEL02637.1 protein of unknown function [Ruminococcus albus]
MAEEFDQEEYDRLQGEKSANLAEQEACQARIDSLNQKIEDLKAAYDKLDEAKETLKDATGTLKKVPSKQFNGWKGSVADEVKSTCKDSDNSLRSQYETYTEKIDEIEDSINWQIHDLKSQKNEQYGILGDLMDAFDWIGTQIHNLFN